MYKIFYSNSYRDIFFTCYFEIKLCQILMLSLLLVQQSFSLGNLFRAKPADIFEAIERKDMDACKRFAKEHGALLQTNKDGQTPLHEVCGKTSNFYESEGRRFFYIRSWIAFLSFISCVGVAGILYTSYYDTYYVRIDPAQGNYKAFQFLYVMACRIFLAFDSLYEREERRFFYNNLSLMLFGLWYCNDVPSRNFLYVNFFGMLFSSGPLFIEENWRFCLLHFYEMLFGINHFFHGDSFFYFNLIGILCSFGSLWVEEDRPFFYIHLAEILLSNGANIGAQNKDGNTALHLASSEGNGPMCELLLRKGANIENRNKDGNTALHIAAAASHLVSRMSYPSAHISTWPWRSNRDYICELLLKKGANILDKNNDGSTALHIACRTAHQASRLSTPPIISPFWKGDNDFICKLLLERGAIFDARNNTEDTIINIQDNAGNTCLHIVSELGNESICKLLLEWRARIETQDTHKRTALHRACGNGHESIGKLLVGRGANIEARDKDGKTPLHLACESGNKSLCEFLLTKNHLNIEAKYDDGKTAMHLACGKGDIALCKLLLGEGASINARTNSYVTPLMIACKEGHQDVVSLLLTNKRLQKELRDTNLEGTALHWACYYNWIEICRELLRAGYDPNEKAKTLSLLHSAVKNGSSELVELFLDHQKDINASDKNGETALHLACSKGDTVNCTSLLNKGASINAVTNSNATPLMIACKEGHQDVVRLLLAHKGIQKELKDDTLEGTALHWACHCNQIEICRELLAYGFDPNEKANTQSLLHLAIKNNNQELFDLFFEKQENPNTQDKNGVTPLHLAIELDRKPMVEQLLLKKARKKVFLDIKTRAGKTPLHYAVENNRVDAVRLLLKYDALPNEKDMHGKTALMYAAEKHQLESCQLIIKKISRLDFNNVRSTLRRLVSGKADLEKLFDSTYGKLQLSPLEEQGEVRERFSAISSRDGEPFVNLKTDHEQTSSEHGPYIGTHEETDVIDELDEGILDQVSEDDSTSD